MVTHRTLKPLQRNPPGTRIFEEIISDPRIPDDYHLINETHPAPVERPSSAVVIKDWIVTQITVAREHFQRQNYMQALAVIENTRNHDYISMLATFPTNSYTTKQVRWHLQDIALVEYCCRLVSAHESQIGNLDVSETVNQLNATVLEPIGGVKAATKGGFRTTFRLLQDPLVDYTLGILSRSWAELSIGQNVHQTLDVDGVQSASVDQVALATALLPFLKVIVARNLLPSRTSLLLDTTAMLASESPRKMVFEALVIAGDIPCAMEFFKVWNKRDRPDWLLSWDNVDFKQWTTKNLVASDWMLDLVRLSHQSRPEWLQDLLSALSSIQPSLQDHQGPSLGGIFALSEFDSSVFPHKHQFYKDTGIGRLDLLVSWISGTRALDPQRIHLHGLAAKELWQEMAVVGLLAKELTVQDILRSIKKLSVVIDLDTPSYSFNGIMSKTSEQYSDSLTQYLGSINSNGDSVSEASLLLLQSIQALMTRNRTGSAPDKSLLIEYQNFLLSVAFSASTRLGHLGLFSHVSELKFLTSYGKEAWEETVREQTVYQSRSEQSTDTSQCTRKGLDITHIDGVREFVEGPMRSNLAKFSATSATISDLSNAERGGRFSDWFMVMAESSPSTGPIARSLQNQGRLDPLSTAYQQALWTLIKEEEYDLAASLHGVTYGLSHGTLSTFKSTFKKSDIILRPTAREVGLLVRALANSDKDPRHLQLAQTIVDQHLEIERKTKHLRRALSVAEYNLEVDRNTSTSTDNQKSSIDIQVMTDLAGAWSRKANYARLRHVLDIVRQQELQPNMFLYNTLLKALMDLTPVPRTGARSHGSGPHPGTRELGHELMVRQLLRSKKDPANQPHSHRDDQSSELQEGWEIFQGLIAQDQKRSFQVPRILSRQGYDLDSPALLKSLILNPSITRDSSFRPDAFTFSILLAAFARRGEIEPISELFAEMKELGIEPDEVICSILANALAKRGDLRSVDRVTQEARNRRMEPGLPLSNIILDSLVEMNAPVASIRDALDRMIAKSGVVEITDSDIEVEIPVRKQNFVKSPRFQQQSPDITAEVLSVDKTLTLGQQRTRIGGGAERITALDAVTMSTLIKYHTRQNDLQAAEDILEAMVQAGFAPGPHVYVMLMAACIRKRDVPSGVSVIRTMRTTSGMNVDAKAWKGLFRCALDVETRQSSRGQSKLREITAQHRMIPQTSLCEQIRDEKEENTGPVSVKLVTMVLQELTVVIEEMKKNSGSKMVVNTQSNLPQEYLRKVLTSSWVRLKETDGPVVTLSRKGRPIINAEVKGQNGLLRRLLGHLLWDAKNSFPERRLPVILDSPSIPRPGKKQDHCQAGDEQQQGRDLYSKLEKKETWEADDREQRCEQAIQLVRLVESTGIVLGERWKWDVVVHPIASLTGQNPRSVLSRMDPHTRGRALWSSPSPSSSSSPS
ncbi:hypothetical protein BGZ83_004573 [Gryganskiella cystojenkinii]|nr:hypothetical protein BGZ83_004573 [Gryganskiella cystojenkinii]